MLAGRRAFAGATAAETLAATLRDEPEEPAILALSAAAPLGWVLKRCLAKDPDQRYDSTRDLALELARIRAQLTAPVPLAPAQSSDGAARVRRLWIPVFVATVLVLATAVYWGRRSPQPLFTQITFGRGTRGWGAMRRTGDGRLLGRMGRRGVPTLSQGAARAAVFSHCRWRHRWACWPCRAPASWRWPRVCARGYQVA